MSQDTRTFLGFVIIGLLITVWLWWMTPPVTVEQKPTNPVAAVDSAARRSAPVETPAIPDSVRRQTSFGTLFSRAAQGTEQRIGVKTSLYSAEITTHGGALTSFQLLKYKKWDGQPVEMIDSRLSSQLNVLFESNDSKLISTKDLYFTTDAPPSIELHNDSAIITFILALDSGKSIEKKFTFHDGSYLVDADFAFHNCGAIIGNYHYQVTWDRGLPFAERNSIDECEGAEATAYMSGEVETLDATKQDEKYKTAPSGKTNWVATRNKYFVAALIAPVPAEGAFLEGKRVSLPDSGAKEEYNIALQFPFHKDASEHARVQVYIGPLDYSIVKGLGVSLEETMSFGWKYGIRQINIYFLQPTFNFIHQFIPNYGLVLMVFALLIRALLTPLSLGQMKSAKKMQLMQPLLAQLKEKFKDDPAKMNAESMKLYSTYGINPAGGCLPLLMQMPLLFAMYPLFRNSISLRQSSFALWITDLSVPDIALHLPFRIPLIGLDHLSGLAVLMGVSIFVQQKMTTSSAPNQKAMMYMMPIMMPLMFASLPAGLNLYYVMSNLLSIVQQAWFNKRHSEITLETVKRDAKNGTGGKMSFTQRVLAAQEDAKKNAGKKRGRK